jgi:hypothetical protein
MYFASARRQGAVVLAALVLVACSSSSATGSSLGGESSGDSGLALMQDGARSGANTEDAAVDYDAAVAACASSASPADRVACCEQQIPRGYLTLHVAEQGCLCGSNGPCLSACNYQDCTSLEGSTPTCQSCLDTNLAGSCKSTVATACAADPGCVAYEECVKAGV